MCVRMSVYSHIPKTTCPNFTKFLIFLHMLAVAVARSSSDVNTICYVLPVLWMTSLLSIIGEAKATPVGRILSDVPGAATGRSLMSAIALLQTLNCK